MFWYLPFFKSFAVVVAVGDGQEFFVGSFSDTRGCMYISDGYLVGPVCVVVISTSCGRVGARRSLGELVEWERCYCTTLG